VERLAARRIPVFFVTTSEPAGRAEKLAAAVKKRGREIRVVSGLYGDALDAPGTPGGTWAGAMRLNVEKIVAALR
jgi:ABC-type Zn uptake system ZnuABC Zn-binding protein ZnuA